LTPRTPATHAGALRRTLACVDPDTLAAEAALVKLLHALAAELDTAPQAPARTSAAYLAGLGQLRRAANAAAKTRQPTRAVSKLDELRAAARRIA
jgi:hypothetical protein